MADQIPPKNPNATDEIDLGQLLELIKKGIKSFGNFFLRIFIYLRRNAFILGGLVIIGLAASFGLNQIISKKLKTDVIVRPNFESKNYLFDVVEELAANIKSTDAIFLQELGIAEKELDGFNIEVEAIEADEVKSEEVVLNEMKYLEVLQNFKDESFVIDILRSELSEKSVIDYKITFTYKDPLSGPSLVQKLMDRINTNDYFNDLKTVYEVNAKARIEKNTVLIAQIDDLVGNYSKSLLVEKEKSGTGLVYMEKENTLNVPMLLDLKNELLKEIESKRLEMAQQKGVISVLNFGRTQQVTKSFFNKTYFLVPSLLVAGFILLSFFKYLERKAKEIE